MSILKKSNEEKTNDDSRLLNISLDIFDDAFVGLTKDFKISLWSKGAEKRLGYLRDEIIGKDLNYIVPEKLMTEYAVQIKEVMMGKVVTNKETKRLHKSGHLVDVSISITPIFNFDNEVIGAIGVYKDITEIKELKNKLIEHEERWRYALEGGRFGVWDWNIASNNILYSNLFNEILGYKDGDIPESCDAVVSKIHPEDYSLIKEKINNHFNKEEEFAVEFRMQCKNNDYKWIRSRGNIIERSDDGTPVRMVGIHEDITQRKMMENELQRRYRQLEQLKEKAESANRAKSQFLANMTHEIRTPLNGIYGAIQLLNSTNMSEQQKRFVDILTESSNVLIEIIDDILDISKIEAGIIEIKNEPFYLKSAINSIYESLLLAGNAKGLEIGYYLDPRIDVNVIGDELKVKQILANLISNAVKFTDQGYVSLRANLISSSDNFVNIKFTVKDSGIGIEDNYKERIFDNFSQGDLSIRKKYTGTGLGLAISKRLALAMGGDISFESELGKGSSFYFICEFEKVNETIDTTLTKHRVDEKNNTYSSKHDKVVLCVEDNLINQEIIDGIVKGKGYQCIAAYNGIEALTILKTNKIDIILMDLQMPGMNGFEATRLIRNGDENIKHIPIIAITAYATPENKEKCITEGMNGFISKPFEIKNIYDVLETHLG